ncbi:hypothetical protein H4R35_004010 [Dimargaris xerosporica]|nr:hypothetical protein H4R35_004010 [Dimargaris xerosporica]
MGGFGDVHTASSPTQGSQTQLPTWYYRYSAQYLEVCGLTGYKSALTMSTTAKLDLQPTGSGPVLATLHLSQLTDDPLDHVAIVHVAPALLGMASRYLIVATWNRATDQSHLFCFDPFTLVTYPLPVHVMTRISIVALSAPTMMPASNARGVAPPSTESPFAMSELPEDAWQYLLAIGTVQGIVTVHRLLIPKEANALHRIIYEPAGEVTGLSDMVITALDWLPTPTDAPSDNQTNSCLLVVGDSQGTVRLCRCATATIKCVEQIQPDRVAGAVDRLVVVMANSTAKSKAKAATHIYRLFVGYNVTTTTKGATLTGPPIAEYTLEVRPKSVKARFVCQTVHSTAQPGDAISEEHLLALSPSYTSAHDTEQHSSRQGSAVRLLAISTVYPNQAATGYLVVQDWSFDQHKANRRSELVLSDLASNSVLELLPIPTTQTSDDQWLLLTPYHILGHTTATAPAPQVPAASRLSPAPTTGEMLPLPLDLHQWFNFHPNAFPYKPTTLQYLHQRRRNSPGGQLFLDRLCHPLGIATRQSYPPKDGQHLRKLLITITEASAGSLLAKYRAIYYLLLDYEDAALAASFQATQVVPLGSARLVMGYWALDHERHCQAFTALINPAVAVPHPNQVLQAWIDHEQYLLALHYLEVQTDAAGSDFSVDPTVHMTVLLHCDLQAAFLFQRRQASQASHDLAKASFSVSRSSPLALFGQLLDFIFCHLENSDYLYTLLGLPFTPQEERFLVGYCQRNDAPWVCRDFLLVYFIQHGRQVEAVQLHESIQAQERKSSSHAQPSLTHMTGAANQTVRHNRLPLVENLLLLLPQVQKSLLDMPTATSTDVVTSVPQPDVESSTMGTGPATPVTVIEDIPFAHKLPTTPTATPKLSTSPSVPPLSASKLIHRTPLSLFRRRIIDRDGRPTARMPSLNHVASDSVDRRHASASPQTTLLQALTKQMHYQNSVMESDSAYEQRDSLAKTGSLFPDDDMDDDTSTDQAVMADGPPSASGKLAHRHQSPAYVFDHISVSPYSPKLASLANSPFVGPPATPSQLLQFSSPSSGPKHDAAPSPSTPGPSPLSSRAVTYVMANRTSYNATPSHSGRGFLPAMRSPLGPASSERHSRPHEADGLNGSSGKPAPRTPANPYNTRHATPHNKGREASGDIATLCLPSTGKKGLMNSSTTTPFTPRRSARLQSLYRQQTPSHQSTNAGALSAETLERVAMEKIPGSLPRPAYRPPAAPAVTPRPTRKSAARKVTIGDSAEQMQINAPDTAAGHYNNDTDMPLEMTAYKTSPRVNKPMPPRTQNATSRRFTNRRAAKK